MSKRTGRNVQPSWNKSQHRSTKRRQSEYYEYSYRTDKTRTCGGHNGRTTTMGPMGGRTGHIEHCVAILVSRNFDWTHFYWRLEKNALPSPAQLRQGGRGRRALGLWRASCAVSSSVRGIVTNPANKVVTTLEANIKAEGVSRRVRSAAASHHRQGDERWSLDDAVERHRCI